MAFSIHDLQKTELFNGICAENIGLLLRDTQSEFRSFREGEVILEPHTEVNRILLLLEGRVHVISNNLWGDRNLLAELGEGEVFCAEYWLITTENYPFQVVAACPASILYLDPSFLTGFRSSAVASCHQQLMSNFLRMITMRNLRFMQKTDILSQRTTRQKLLRFFSVLRSQHQSSEFDITLSRQELADFLSVDRSAMSCELNKMQKDGLIRYNLNHFELIGMPEDYPEAP